MHRCDRVNRRRALVVFQRCVDRKKPRMTRVDSRLPRLGPSIVRRYALEEWLLRFKGAPVRFLIAPPGFGKTMALLGYLQHLETPGVYCTLSPGSGSESFLNSMAGALGVEAGLSSHEELLNALAAKAPLEVAIDCEDVPEAEGAAAVLRLVRDLPEDVSLLIACRSREPFSVTRLVSEGVGVLCGPSRLAFSATEVRHIAETYGVPFAHQDIAHFLEATDGWPQVASAALRKAAEDRCDLAHALPNWRRHHGYLFNEFVKDASRHAPEREGGLVRKLMGGSHLGEQAQLQELEAAGLFVIHTPAGYRPLRTLLHGRVRHASAATSAAMPPMQVHLLGWFSARIDRQPIKWVRRRDRRIFEFVALRPNGCATRAEIGEAFWPGGDAHLVAQSVRTACSHIRKAIAVVVGPDAVDAYFATTGNVSINPDNVIVDVNRFVANADQADELYRRAQWQSAYARYQRAANLYAHDLLIADSHEPWVTARESTLRRRYAEVEARMADCAARGPSASPPHAAQTS